MSEYRMKSKLDGGKLIIQGHAYRLKTVHLLPEPLTGYNVMSKEGDDHIGFFGELNLLSNFHPASFTIDGIKFHSSEQWIQYQKVKLFKDDHTVKKILESEMALECQRLSREISNFDPIDWRDQARPLCEPGIREKFTQNPILLKLLASTGNKKLVECAYNRLWGSGVSFFEENPFDEARWSGDNLLGVLLMNIQATMLTITGNNVDEPMDK